MTTTLLCCDTAEMLAQLPPLSASFIHADPPWDYQNWTDTKQGAASAYYDGLSMADIAAHATSAYSVAAKDAYLLVWCTFPKLQEWLCSSQNLGGWQYITGGMWGKTNGLGIGFHVRGDSEPWLLYKKGAPRPQTHMSNLFLAPRIGHSEKPQVALRALVAMAAPPDGLVVDLYAGASASLARACRALGRSYVGAEIDPARHAQALLRLSQQEMLFAS
jgi:N6-adenosine-specific RNA methylase IME4